MEKMKEIIKKNCLLIEPDMEFYDVYKMLYQFKWELAERIDDNSISTFLDQMDILTGEILRVIHEKEQFEKEKNKLYLENLKLKGRTGD